ncbi:uncharacterized protein TTMY_2576 (plasmid) [Thermus thermophilus]|nr:uncharacterized protein TTMY_2576 [Thermus thermophilus]BDB12573.1 hypothetical protein TthTMY_23120 [Thermus thermophilus]
MKPYANLSGKSGVVAYEEGPDWICVKFSDGSSYLYTYRSAGSHHVEEMKRLARQGQGLNAYINRFVRKLYASKGC